MYFFSVWVNLITIKIITFRATVANLESKVETLTTSNTLIKEELDMAKTSLSELQEENQSLKNQLIKKDDTTNVDIFFFFKLKIKN